jgi:hypothetical protein
MVYLELVDFEPAPSQYQLARARQAEAAPPAAS